MKSRLFFFLVGLNFVFSILSSQNGITYNQFISSIIENHPLTEKAENLSRQGVYMVNSARGSYDPVVNSQYENKYFNSKNYFSVLHTEIKQPIFTNQYLSAGFDYGQGNYVSPNEVTPITGTPFIGVETSLLQGLLFDKRRAEVLKSKEYKNYYE